VLIARPANSFGPWQFPEKLIPLTLARALDGEKLAVYGDGRQEREWLHVGDHCAGVDAVLRHGRPGRAYNLAGVESRTNIEVVEALCRLLDESRPRADGRPYHNQIAFVADRPGHDRRYAIDPARAAAELGWRPATGFDDGLAATVDWYLENETWWRDIRATRYAGERLGVGR
jgi:dTDP-glucose 4,6-dehydratase